MSKTIQIILGTILVLAGAIVTPLPPPFAFGIPLMIIGLALLAPHVPYVATLIRRARSRSPNVNHSMVKHRDKFPKIVKDVIDTTQPEENM